VIGEFVDGFELIFNDGQFHIVETSGHKGSELITFPEPPMRNPDPDCSSKSQYVIDKATAWSKLVKSYNFRMSVIVAHRFFEACKAAEEDPFIEGGRLENWVVDRAGKLVEKYVTSTSTPPVEEEDEYEGWLGLSKGRLEDSNELRPETRRP
jgi:hypothetical protein